MSKIMYVPHTPGGTALFLDQGRNGGAGNRQSIGGCGTHAVQGMGRI